MIASFDDDQQTLLIFHLLLLAHARAYILSKVTVGDDGCWIPCTSGDGRYKHGWIFGVRFKMHVLSWLAFRGSLKRHHVVDHKECDNPACCAPHHLKACSQSDNMKRCFQVGRLTSAFQPKTEIV